VVHWRIGAMARARDYDRHSLTQLDLIIGEVRRDTLYAYVNAALGARSFSPSPSPIPRSPSPFLEEIACRH
jgi:hypothetical protein